MMETRLDISGMPTSCGRRMRRSSRSLLKSLRSRQSISKSGVSVGSRLFYLKRHAAWNPEQEFDLVDSRRTYFSDFNRVDLPAAAGCPNAIRASEAPARTWQV